MDPTPASLETPADAPVALAHGTHPRLANVMLAILISLALAGTSLFLFTRNNDFPLHYHPDEGTKVGQLQSPRQPRNLNHPLLLLETANLARVAWGVPLQDERQLAIVGRWSSALLASVGVFALAMAAFAGQGWIGLAIVGPMAALCPPLLVYAHYLKEDTALVGGLCVVMLGIRLVLLPRRPHAQLLATLVLSVGCAAAASGKYVGIIAFVPALAALLAASCSRWWLVPARLGVFAVVALGATVAINFRAFDDPWTLDARSLLPARVEQSIDHVLSGHDGVALISPNTFCIRTAAGELMPHVWIFAAAGIVALATLFMLRRRLLLSRFGIVCFIFVATIAVVLSHNRIPFPRYALPLSVLGYFAAGSFLAAALVAWRPTSIWARRVRLGITIACVATITIAQGGRCLAFNHQFADDSRQRLREWLAANVKPGESIVADGYSNVLSEGDPWRFPKQSNPQLDVWAWGVAGSRGSMDRLSRQGVRYVITCEPTYKRFMLPDVLIEPRDRWLQSMRSFYGNLEANGDLVWSSIPSPPSNAYVNPAIRVYRVPRPASDVEPRRPRRAEPGILDELWKLLPAD